MYLKYCNIIPCTLLSRLVYNNIHICLCCLSQHTQVTQMGIIDSFDSLKSSVMSVSR